MVGNPAMLVRLRPPLIWIYVAKFGVIPDFPKPGVSYKDITTLLKDGAALRYVVDRMAEYYADKPVDVIVGN